MRVNGYGVRPGNNGYSGQQKSGDEYNRSYKQVRYTRAEEYATRDVKEFHHYPEQKDLTKERDDKKKQQNNTKNNSSKNSGSSSGGVHSIAQVVVALAGAAVITVSYTSAMAKRAEKQVEDPSSSVVQTTDEDNAGLTATWEWSEDNKAAMLILTDSEGNVVAQISAEVTDTEEPAKCTEPGKITYTATAAYEDKTYTDTRDKELPALGHDFDSGTQTVLDNGETAVNFECYRCGEHFVVQNSLTEE